jgi:hypothetical protein
MQLVTQSLEVFRNVHGVRLGLALGERLLPACGQRFLQLMLCPLQVSKKGRLLGSLLRAVLQFENR